MFNVEVDDVLTPRRQAELDRVADGLARFEATKVVVEQPADDPALLDRFRACGAGALPADRSEVVQIGFRVARILSHARIFGVDVAGVFHDGRIDEFVAQQPHQRRWEALLRALERDVSEKSEWVRDHDLGEVLRRLNDPRIVNSCLQPYLEHLLPISGADGQPGPDMVANWYRRNMRIAANIHQLVEPRDRILVVYGLGHIPVLTHLLGGSSELAIEDPLRYL